MNIEHKLELAFKELLKNKSDITSYIGFDTTVLETPCYQIHVEQSESEIIGDVITGNSNSLLKISIVTNSIDNDATIHFSMVQDLREIIFDTEFYDLFNTELNKHDVKLYDYTPTEFSNEMIDDLRISQQSILIYAGYMEGINND